MVIPNDDLVALLLIHEHNHIGLVHHFDESDLLAQVLDLLLQPRTSRIILQNLETCLRRNCKVFLCLVWCNRIYLRLLIILCSFSSASIVLIFDCLFMGLLVFLDYDFVNDSILRWHHVTLFINALLNVGLVLVSWSSLLWVLWLGTGCCVSFSSVFHICWLIILTVSSDQIFLPIIKIRLYCPNVYYLI